LPDKYQKYIDAHNGTTGHPSYEEALREIQNKCTKIGHWIWYILPGNIGVSPTAKYYILHENEVLGYLDNSMLKDHYIKIVEAIKECLIKKTAKEKLFVEHIDIDKAKTSMTLFKKGTNNIDIHQDVHTLCTDTLELMN
jgi:uncharacterized protein (DUF1810 family)